MKYSLAGGASLFLLGSCWHRRLPTDGVLGLLVRLLCSTHRPPSVANLPTCRHDQPPTFNGEHIYSENYVFFEEDATFVEGQTAIYVDNGLVE